MILNGLIKRPFIYGISIVVEVRVSRQMRVEMNIITENDTERECRRI